MTIKHDKRGGGKERAAEETEGLPEAAEVKKTRLTPRQSKFLEGVIAGKTQYQAALSAGYSKNGAKNPHTLLKAKALQEAFGELMPSVEKLAQGICEGISAERVEFVKMKGAVTDKRSHIDWDQRRKYIELAAKLRGFMNHAKGDAEANANVQVTIEHIGGK